MNVFATSPTWSLSGVNTFAVNLLRGLQAVGSEVRLLLTDADRYDPYPISLPVDIPVERLTVSRWGGWRARWRSLIHCLEAHAPCIYLPNYDFRCSCVSPQLSTQVGIVGIVHGDNASHYEHVGRLGRYWDAVVAVSKTVAEGTLTLDPTLATRLVMIPYGVQIPCRLPDRQWEKGTPLQIVYAGRLVQPLKRVLDLSRIAVMLAEQDVPIIWSIVGSGPEQGCLMEGCAELVNQEKVRFLGTLSNTQVLALFEQSDVFILTSESEGLPLSLLEAMGQGCVPVVTDIRSGIPELVQDGVNGFRVGVGDIEGFVERLALLQRQPSLRRQMALRAHRTIRDGGYRVEDMVQRYLALFERVLRDADRGDYRRPPGKILPPPSLKTEVFWETWLTPPGWRCARGVKRILQQVFSKGKVQTH